ncbi:MAG: hypothetical protein RR307_06005 [Clostridia bacterium]
MRGEFFAGLALGAMIGAIVLEASPETKKAVSKGQTMLGDKIESITKKMKKK